MSYLLEDFTDANVVASRGRVFSDWVMGGVSNACADVSEVAGRAAWRLSGNVSLERNGGFIQVARSLEGERFDVSLPWRAFTPASVRALLDRSTRQRIGLVAGTTAFDASVAISRLELVGVR
ncbi:CIA30 family protein [Gemmatimonas sp.]|uniref:CIA30 family protein n=1 Tax=Gemmatimonas sp. TaxID=1962908 RepID=UPI003983CF26